jgi:glycosyltransferase involved in cell wall biosynthesis
MASELAGKKLLICSQGVPHPTRGASAVIFHHYIDRLRQEGFRILHVLLLQPHDTSERELCDYVDRMAEPGRFNIEACWSNRLVVHQAWGLRLDTASLSPGLRAAESFQPDACFAIDVVPTWAVQSLRVPARMVWLGDLAFHAQFYHAWYSCREKPTRLFKLPTALWRCEQWKGIYRDVLRGADCIIASSKSSERHLRHLGITCRYHPYPWPNHATSARIGPRNRHDVPSFFFMGNLVGLGSRSAFHFLLGRVYPQLIQRWGRHGFQILIAGRTSLPAWVEQAIASAPEFKYLGFVDDIDSLMSSCHASLAPIDVPVGNRTRILSAMAKGSLVIAHQATALGNPDLVDGETCYLAGDARMFARRMIDAVEHPERSVPVVASARRCYQAHFRPEAATKVVVDEFCRLLSGGGLRQAA